MLLCGIATVNSMKKLKIAFNNSIRRLYCPPKHNSASEMCVCLSIMSFCELLYYIAFLLHYNRLL